ncbi:mechanosensitive ion channel family protein [Halobacterium litoreum]|uniref:Uncharacterized protein n=1 Tax=Halobacterium litoreum TaxID=2039234 RepID=A0ABD5NE62_9EURY|nr:hypothetical protein [Halobacterium litoreum]UHH13724.1 hypothetical protein LT972_01705 [Halobacterium litoreum]
MSSVQQFVVAQQSVQSALREAVNEAIAFLPNLLGAVVVLVVGWLVGRVVGRAVRRVANAAGLDERIEGSSVDRFLGREERAGAKTLGRLAAWYVYLVTVLAAANVLAIDTLSEWLSTAVSYLPAFLAGIVLIVVGFVLADFVADVVARTETVTGTGYTDVFADGLRVFLYFVALVIGLDTMGVDVAILYVFAQAAAWGVAAAIALAAGIAFGWGGKDYVQNNIADWTGSVTGPSGGAAGAQADDADDD